MTWLIQTLQRFPEIAIFLALAVGFSIGGVKAGKFSLGDVTGILIAGVIIGQIGISISSDVKSVFSFRSVTALPHKSFLWPLRRSKGCAH